MGILHKIESLLVAWANQVPVEMFTFFGAFIEEIIAPIPSPLILTLAGSIAYSQGKSAVFLFWLSLVGTVGKTIGAWVVYYIARKLEEVIISKFGRFLGVSNKDVAKISGFFKGGWKDGVILFALRSLPIVPTSPVSVVCGVIGFDLRTYLMATLLGTFIRNLLYLYFGFSGVAAYHSMLSGLGRIESIVQILMFVGVLAALGWFYYLRRKNNPNQDAS